MTELAHRKAREARVVAACAVAVLHALAGYVLLTGFGFRFEPRSEQTLKLFDVAPSVPPPPAVSPSPAKAAEGASGPPNRHAKASPVVAPKPQIVFAVPPPVVAAPVPAAASDLSAGASDLPGPGAAGGGEGAGRGSGGVGNGSGGGLAARARWLSGSIRDRDYPRSARAARAGGTAVVRFEVAADGRARSCTVSQSSGHPDLDATTCRLIEQRFRYAPALDRSGRPTSEFKGWKQDWWLESAAGSNPIR